LNKKLRKQVFGRTSLLGLLLIFLLPFFVVVYQLIAEIDVGINFAQKERLGIKYNPPLKALLEDVQRHRGMVNGYLKGDTSFKEKIFLNESQIEDDIRAIDAIDRQLGVTLQTTEQWRALKKNWQTLKGTALGIRDQESFEAHTALINEILSLMAHVADTSNLILDPVLDSYYLMDALVNKLPYIIDTTGQVRGLGTGVAAQQRISAG
jgi:hypothetical protein